VIIHGLHGFRGLQGRGRAATRIAGLRPARRNANKSGNQERLESSTLLIAALIRVARPDGPVRVAAVALAVLSAMSSDHASHKAANGASPRFIVA
jgi:hypothetical protein